MKAVLMSIQPRWCELIASGKKTVEVRKTRPQQMETPFRVYIYCTKNTRKNALHTYINSGYGRRNFGIIGQWRSGKEVVDVNPHLPAYRYNSYLAEGKIIGEFICDRIRNESEVADGLVDIALEKTSCVSAKELVEYANGKELYSWHISQLIIYDKPRELSAFRLDCTGEDCGACKRSIKEKMGCLSALTRPPQSWCYVEEI